MTNSDTEPTPSPSSSTTSEMNGAVGTITITEEHRDTTSAPTLRLVLKKPKNSKKVNWTTETVDNEGMNKRKSKCCCIYKKPHVFGESSSESDEDECENCFGHCELKKRGGDPPPPPSVPPVS